MRQTAEHLENRLEQGRRGVLALEAEVTSILTQGQRSELEARIREEQAMEYAHHQQMAHVTSLHHRATQEMEESDSQRRAIVDRLASVEHQANRMVVQAEHQIERRDANLAEARRWAEHWGHVSHVRRTEMEETDIHATNRSRHLEQPLRHANESLAESNRIITAKNEDIRHEVIVARRLRQTT